jgi:hypothetical protein
VLGQPEQTLWFGVSRSVGYISQTLASIGEQAKAFNAGISIPLAVLGEADEIFQGRKPCLTGFNLFIHQLIFDHLCEKLE